MTYIKRSDGAYCAYSMSLSDIIIMLMAQDLTCIEIKKEDFDIQQEMNI